MNTIIGNLMKWNRPLTTREINLISEDNFLYVHVTIIRWQKKGFWNKVFRRKEIIVYLNGEEKNRVNDFIGSLYWWARLI